MKLILLVGPAGAGKSTYAKELEQRGYFRISQDEQGKDGHFQNFKNAVNCGLNIVIDRMNFDKKQRIKYLAPVEFMGYETEIVVFHVPRDTCFKRIMARENHPTINGDIFMGDATKIGCFIEKERQANSALDTFFTKYERVEDSEADKVTRLGWDEQKPVTRPAVICDLDGTLCDLTHRLHYVKNENKKHNRWDLFNKKVGEDGLHSWCARLLLHLQHGTMNESSCYTVLCSGRVDSCRKDTEEWLQKYDIDYDNLFMRHRSDFRQDYIIKEIILDFEILPRYNVLFAIDDRQQVVDMWRRRGIVCLQCAPGDF